MRELELTWNEFWAEHWRIDHRHNIPGIFEWDEQLISFVEHTCDLEPGMRVLDLACGGGDQARVLARRGYEVVGVDIAPALILHARETFQSEGLDARFFVGDMRQLGFVDEFDAVLLLSGSFGFFGPEGDLGVLQSISMALRPGARAFIMYLSLENQPEHQRTWTELANGWSMAETWFDAETCERRSRNFFIGKDGTIIRPKVEPGYHANETIRCYTVPEIRRFLTDAGLQEVAFYNRHQLSQVPPVSPRPWDPRDIVVAERPGSVQ